MITPSFGLTATERVLPKLALDFTTASLDPRITFTRALNTATVTNSSGYIVPINADLPRFDYDPITKVCKGLLIEETRTNLFLQSEDLTTGSWSKNNCTISADATNSPANTTTADLIVENTATSTHFVEQIVTFGSGVISYSVYLKASTRTKARLQMSDYSVGIVRVDVDLSAGTLGTPVAQASWSAASATISPAANGFYRVTLTATASAGTIKGADVFLLDAAGANSYTGDGASGLFFWGGQFEAAAFPTSYIPTTTTAVTRNADVATMTGANFSSWFNASEGTFSIAWNIPSVLIDCVPFTTNDNTDLNRIGCDTTATGFGRIIVSNAGNLEAFGGTSGILVGKNTISVGYKNNNFGVANNGGTVTTDASGTVPTVDRLQIGRRLTSLYINGTVSKLNYWPQKLTTAEIQAFSK